MQSLVWRSTPGQLLREAYLHAPATSAVVDGREAASVGEEGRQHVPLASAIQDDYLGWIVADLVLHVS